MAIERCVLLCLWRGFNEYLVARQEPLVESFHRKYLSKNGREENLSSSTCAVTELTLTAAGSKQFVNLKICGRLFCVQMTLFSNICTAAVSSIAISLEAAHCASPVSILLVYSPFKKWTQPNSSDNGIAFGQLLARCTWRWYQRARARHELIV